MKLKLRTFWLLLPSAAFVLSGCYKDEVAETDLTTNPYDPDYQGSQFIELDSSKTRIVYDQFLNPVDTTLRLYMSVRVELFDPMLSYVPFIRDLSTGTETEGSITPPWQTQVSVAAGHVVLGNEYCYDVGLIVQGTNTRTYRMCATADL